jgi:hypothetical protein
MQRFFICILTTQIPVQAQCFIFCKSDRMPFCMMLNSHTCTVDLINSTQDQILSLHIRKIYFFQLQIGMHRILFFAGYPANPKAGYRISGRILGLTIIFLVKYQINL